MVCSGFRDDRFLPPQERILRKQARRVCPLNAFALESEKSIKKSNDRLALKSFYKN